MERAEEQMIDQKYLDMVARFQAVPNNRTNTVKRLKMMMRFEIWYKDHIEELNKSEREYLQANICRVRTYLDDDEEEKPNEDAYPWGYE